MIIFYIFVRSFVKKKKYSIFVNFAFIILTI